MCIVVVPTTTVVTVFLNLPVMSYLVFGRAIKNEHLALGVLTTAFGSAFLATRGGKSDKPAAGMSPQKAKETVPINAGSSEEEDFIKNFIAAAEKEDAGKH